MPIFESGIKKHQEQQRQKLEQQEGPSGPNLREILADPHQSKLVGALLEKKGKDDLGKKLAAGENLTKEEIKQLADYQTEIASVLTETEKIKEIVDNDTIEQISLNSPELRQLSRVVGTEGLRQVIVSQMGLLAIQDKARFKQVTTALQNLKAKREDIKKKDEDLAAICRKYGISEKELEEALATDDDNKRKEKINEILSSRGDTIKSIIRGELGRPEGFLGLLYSRKQRQETEKRFEELTSNLNQKANIDKAAMEVDQLLKKVGSALAVGINKNKEVRHGLVKVLAGQKEKSQENEMNFKEAATPIGTEEEILKEWEEFKRDEGILRRWSNLKTSEQNRYRTKFKDSLIAKKRKGKGGFWDKVFAALAGEYFKNLKLI
jgi:hypothetical protein